MANGADYAGVNGNAVFGLKALSLHIVSTLLNSCVLLAALGLQDSNKMAGIWDPGSPDAGGLISGADVDPIIKKEIVECSQYSPLIEAVWQGDVKVMGYRDTSATLAVGSGATFSVTVTAGVISAVSVTAPGSGYAGCPPTLIPVDSDNTGQGAILRATISGGAVTAVTILSGGYGYGATVSILCQSGNSEGQKNARPVFKWTHVETPYYVYQRDIDRQEALSQGQKQLFDAGVNSLTMAGQKRATATLIQYVEEDAIYGSPTDESADLWDHQHGVASAIDSNNTYGTINRSDTANYYWRAQEDPNTHVFTLEQLWADAMYAKGLSANGGYLSAIIVGPTLFAKFQRESQSYTINANQNPNVQLMKRVYGFKGQCIMYNDTYVLCDYRVAANTVYGINSMGWTFATKQGANFKQSAPKFQGDIEGGKQAWYTRVDLQYMLMCQAPAFGNVKYTAVS